MSASKYPEGPTLGAAIRVALSLGAVLTAPLVLAESAAPGSPQAAAGTYDLPEIVVTAQKRAESLQEVPISITPLPAEALEKARLDSPADLTSMVPNLQMQNTVGDETPIYALRGVSMSDFSLNQASPVATYYDEVYKGNFALFGVSMFDLERIEVLRGPQGTLYGKNTTGGAINFIARKPGFETDGYLTVGYGNYNRIEAAGAFQTALSETFAARVAFTYTKADGWFENLYQNGPDMNAKDEYGARLTLLYKPGDDLEFVLRAATSLQQMTNYGIYADPYEELGCIGAGVYTAFHELYPASNPNVDDCRTGMGTRQITSEFTPDRKNRTNSVSLTVNWKLSDAFTLTSVSSWDEGKLRIPEDSDGSYLAVLQSDYDDKVDQIAQDLRLDGTIGDFKFIVGGYYNREKVYNSTTLRLFTDIDVNGDGVFDNVDCQVGIDLGLLGCQVRNAFDQTKESIAAYTDMSYAVSPKVTLRGGIRYTRDDGKQYNMTSNIFGTDEVFLGNLIPGPPPVTNLGASCTASGETTAQCEFSENKVTGKLGLDYTTDGGQLLYVSASRGYRAGAFNAQAFFQPGDLSVAKPETVDAIEAGFKTRLADNRVTFNGAVFHYTYKNQQILNTDPETFAQTLVNLPESRIQGAEFELTARPVPSLTLTAGLGLLDTEVKGGTVSGVSVDGTRLASAPSVSFAGAIDWRAFANDSYTTTLHLDGTYSTRQYFDPWNKLSQDSYGLLNARVDFRFAEDRWGVALWGKNLADKFYFTNRIDLPSFGYLYEHIGNPRTYGITLDYRF